MYTFEQFFFKKIIIYFKTSKNQLMFYTICEKYLNLLMLLSIEANLTVNTINYDNIIKNYTYRISRKKGLIY